MQRVSRSVMAAEIHALLYGFEQIFGIQHLINKLFERRFDIYVLIDSKALCDVVTKEGKHLKNFSK